MGPPPPLLPPSCPPPPPRPHPANSRAVWLPVGLTGGKRSTDFGGFATGLKSAFSLRGRVLCDAVTDGLSRLAFKHPVSLIPHFPQEIRALGLSYSADYLGQAYWTNRIETKEANVGFCAISEESYINVISDFTSASFHPS